MTKIILQSLTPFTVSDSDSIKMRILCKGCNFLYLSAVIIAVFTMAKYRLGYLGHVPSAIIGLIECCMIGVLMQLLRNRKIEEKGGNICPLNQQILSSEDHVESFDDSDIDHQFSKRFFESLEDIKEQMTNNNNTITSFIENLFEKKFSRPLTILKENVNSLHKDVRQLEKGRPGRTTLQNGETPFADKTMQALFNKYIKQKKNNTINSVNGRAIVEALYYLNNNRNQFLKNNVSKRTLSLWIHRKYLAKFTEGKEKGKKITASSIQNAQNFEEAQKNIMNELREALEIDTKQN